jgi:hypothetical protein
LNSIPRTKKKERKRKKKKKVTKIKNEVNGFLEYKNMQYFETGTSFLSE